MNERWLFINATVGSNTGASVLIQDGYVEEIASRRTLAGVPLVDAHGGAVLPALWDHHVHLRSSAARRRSLNLATARSVDECVDMLLQAARGTAHGQWIRAVGYDEGALGFLDARTLERLAPMSVPIRIQHRSGHQWVLNRAAIRALEEAGRGPVPEDGLLWEADTLLSGMPGGSVREEDLAREARELSRQGCVGATDMTPTMGLDAAQSLAASVRPWLKLGVFGTANHQAVAEKFVATGTKLVLSDHSPTGIEEIISLINASRPGPIALHAVSVESLVLAMCSLAEAGLAGDRIEHAFLTPAGYPREAGRPMRENHSWPIIGVHPGFMWSQGNRLDRVLDREERADYQRLRSWHRAGFNLLGGSDAPYGSGNLWRSMQCAVERRSPNGSVFDPAEALSPEEAFALFTPAGLHGQAQNPQPQEGSPADLCVLSRPWAEVRRNLDTARVAMTMKSGQVVWEKSRSVP